MNNRQGLAAVVPLLMMASVLTAAPVEASHGAGIVTAVDVAAGGHHTCVLLDTSNVDCHGDNWYGQAANYWSGNVVRVAAGGWHTCVLMVAGYVDCYGDNGYGQSAAYWGGNAVGVAAGGEHTCVLLSNGNVDCYGQNIDGQAADYNGGDAVGVSAGGAHTCVLLSNGNADCYGHNGYGQAADWFGDSDGDHGDPCASSWGDADPLLRALDPYADVQGEEDSLGTVRPGACLALDPLLRP